jgi:hypothetical protein
MGFDYHCEQERHDYSLDNDVSEHQGLHYRIHGQFCRRNIGKDRCCTPNAISDAQQQDVSRALKDRKANYRMYQMRAAYQTIEAAEEQPRSYKVRQKMKDVRHGIIPRELRL